MSQLKVVFLSEWISNPYKNLLGSHLQASGVEVREHFWKTFFASMILNPEKPDILHLHTLHPFLRGRYTFSKFFKFCLFVSQLLFLKLLGVKVVWTVHEWIDKLDTGSSEISKGYASIIGRLLHSFIVHSESTKDDIAQAFQLVEQEKIHVIPHGNYIGFYENRIQQQEARKTLGILNNSFVFLLFGGLYRYKGVLEAIHSFKRLRLDDAVLIIAGKPNESSLKSRIQSEIQNCSNIIFISDFISNSDVQVYMNACDCVVVPYRVFTTSGVAILAMSFERACIAPSHGFFYNIFREGGAFLYEMDDPDGLFQAMLIAFQNRELAISMGKRNFELATRWSWDYVASQTLQAYQ